MDRLGVINRALMKVALPLAATLQDCDWNANLVFEDCTTEVLREHSWSFAQRLAVLEMLPDTPAFGFRYAYKMPEDCVHMTDVRAQGDIRAPKAKMVTQGRRVLTNASPCYARYTAKDLDPDNWPSDFTDATACRIAWEIAALSAEKLSLIPSLVQLYQRALNIAMKNDAREETTRVPPDESLYSVRGE